ncbi:SHOCT domain-containing protein [Streptomyces sp. NBC_00140]|uniref:SHOCT domain-containing protein n=1 Tax=Streptomyces sp. NBC_00140 TaxID=2975664 RepID=UPI002255521A|nr:SHOCT domain-containing protein [Streptomyces sp. NBC_00140]MCX5336671.1 SHOCT domain-containing protein [Streptomyces sp. NBC_00140]
MYWNGHDMNGWGWFAMSIGTILLWAALITVAVLLFRTLSRTPEPTHPVSAERLLAERFARGEIDEEEYRRRMSVMRADGVGLPKS